ncbi:proline-rich domain-containing protein [Streptomyces sp. NPDC047841]|uniref:proline-rich domain-containing protein n=1 Tax=Streptomyces sp. NPDC047841 TaxID=3154708 RepID=UPI0034570FF1
MIDMSAWEEISVDVVDELELDPKNVRLELGETAPESDIIHDLFHNEKALTLVESICKVGLLTHETPIALRRDGELVVVEGNRRVAALKAIQNPFLAPGHQARITKARNGVDLNRLRRVSVKIAPNEDEANQLIAAIHTGNQRVSWSPARQAAFFQAQIDSGKSPEYLIAHYPTVEVKKFIIRSQILKLFRDANYRDDSLKQYVKTRTFPVSVLARLYSNEEFLLLAQIQIDENEPKVNLGSTQTQFDKLAEKIVGDIKSKRINTRTLNSTKSESYADYMDQIRELVSSYDESDEAPPSNMSKPQSASTNTQPPYSAAPQGPNPPAQQKAPQGPNPPTQQKAPQAATASAPPTQAQSKPSDKPKELSPNYLNLSQIKIDPSYPPAIRKMCEELAAINVRKFPNATLDLLRTFLEKTIKAYAEKLGVDLKRHAGQQQSGGFIQLGHCLNWLEEHLKATNKTAFVQVIKKIRGNKLGGYIPTVDHMNAINHNHHVFATADEVKACWDGMEGLIRVMLKP